MAILSTEWRDYQIREAVKRMRLVVQDAIIQYPYDRQRFMELQHYAGLQIDSIQLEALRVALQEVSDGIRTEKPSGNEPERKESEILVQV